jgi:hypothetical protein
LLPREVAARTQYPLNSLQNEHFGLGNSQKAAKISYFGDFSTVYENNKIDRRGQAEPFGKQKWQQLATDGRCLTAEKQSVELDPSIDKLA